MPASSLLIDAPEFCAALEPSLLTARRRAFIQAMTFEMDGVGRRFWDLLARSPAREKILCVDAFSRAKISDSLVFGKRYLTDAAFRREARETRRLLRQAAKDGVRIIVTNPMGPLWWKYPYRNHKKLMIADNRAFLGGINFSEHNFAWRDLMLQTESPPLVEALAADFRRTAAGINQSAITRLPAGSLYFLDGRRSRHLWEAIFSEIASARRSIDIISPYVSDPLLRRIARRSASVRVRVIYPARTNKRIMQQALLNAAAETGIEVLLYQPGMSHMKAILVDDTRLILGSCNFDFVAYELQQEIVLSTGETALIKEFRERALNPVLAASVPAGAGPPPRFYHHVGGALALARGYVNLLGRLNR